MPLKYMFERFPETFPSEPEEPKFFDGGLLAKDIENELGCAVPREIEDFWQQVGSAYFGGRVLYFFGEKDERVPRDSLLEWDKKDFWRNIYPIACDGGPVFFRQNVLW